MILVIFRYLGDILYCMLYCEDIIILRGTRGRDLRCFCILVIYLYTLAF